MSNTICEQCFFAKTIGSDKPCVFDIPSIIKEYHTVEEHNNYYKLINYNCRYGFSNKIYHENIDKFNNIDLIEYIKKQNIVSYSLALIVKNMEHEHIVDLLDKLSIQPSYITIICHNNGNDLHNKLLTRQSYIPHKVHNFLADVPAPQALHIALETNKNKIGNLLWILTDNSLEQYIQNDSIQNINYLINVEQRPAHYYQSNNNLNSTFDGIFINSNNYWTLSRTKDYTIEKNKETLVITYD